MQNRHLFQPLEEPMGTARCIPSPYKNIFGTNEREREKKTNVLSVPDKSLSEEELGSHKYGRIDRKDAEDLD